MYRIYKAVYAIKTEQNKTWEECCLRVPVVNIDKMIEEELDGKRRRRRETEEDNWDFSDFDDEEEFVEKTDMSVENYPQPYCGKVSDLPTQCYQESLLELWAVEGVTLIKIYLQLELLRHCHSRTYNILAHPPFVHSKSSKETALPQMH